MSTGAPIRKPLCDCSRCIAPEECPTCTKTQVCADCNAHLAGLLEAIAADAEARGELLA